MKKIILAVLVVALLAGGTSFFLRTKLGHRTRGAELVPAETVLFMHLPDLARTSRRWPETSLAALWREPEVQALLEKPRAKTPEAQTHFRRVEAIQPREAFLAVTSIEGPVPRGIAGVAFSGSQAEFAALLAEPRAAWKRAHPAGKADLLSYAGAEIEVFTEKEFTVAEVFRDGWYFIGNDLELLQRTLDRLDGKPGDATLASAAIFREATEPLPADGDALVVAQLGGVMERLTALLLASGQTIDAKQLAEWKRMRAIASSTKLDGANVRDTLFVLSPESPAAPPMAKNSLALTSPETLVHYAAALPATIELPESTLAMASMFLPAFAQWQKSLAEKGLAIGDLVKAFGPEFGTFVDWPAEAAQPAVAVALDVRELGKARAFTELLTGGGEAVAWTREQRDGMTLFRAPKVALSLATPTIALTDRFLVFSPSDAALDAALARLKAAGPTLTSAPRFAAAVGSIRPPTNSCGFIDMRGLVERAYGNFRPFIAMALAFTPNAGQYIDAAKLPATETLARHFGPIVFSQSDSERGTLVESTGPLTLNQAVIAVVAGSVAAALPQLKNLPLGNFGLDPAKALQPPVAPPVIPPPTEPPVAVP